MKNIFTSSGIRAFSALLAVMLALPFSWKGLTGVYAWLSPFIMLNSVFTLKSYVWLNLTALAVLLFVLFRKRWFCQHLCPVGWGCDLVSGLNKRNTYTYKGLPEIGKWLAVLSLTAALAGFPLLIIFDPLAIFHGFFTIFPGSVPFIAVVSLLGLPVLLGIHLIFPRIWCNKLCPLGGLQLVMADAKTLLDRLVCRKKPEVLPHKSGRRYFLMSGMGFLAGISIPGFLRPSSGIGIRPPAAVNPSLFGYLCCRCGNCSKVCPTRIITPQTDPGNIVNWMTPEISFRSGYCLETCNLCSRVCPSGAITLFGIEAKKQLFMGTAEIQLKDCLLLHNKECVRCRESCKYDALVFVADHSVLQGTPAVYTDKCVGCGACEVICPTGCITVRPLPEKAGEPLT